LPCKIADLNKLEADNVAAISSCMHAELDADTATGMMSRDADTATAESLSNAASAGASGGAGGSDGAGEAGGERKRDGSEDE